MCTIPKTGPCSEPIETVHTILPDHSSFSVFLLVLWKDLRVFLYFYLVMTRFFFSINIQYFPLLRMYWIRAGLNHFHLSGSLCRLLITWVAEKCKHFEWRYHRPTGCRCLRRASGVSVPHSRALSTPCSGSLSQEMRVYVLCADGTGFSVSWRNWKKE